LPFPAPTATRSRNIPTPKPKPVVFYHWKDLNCETCHEDPHKGQFAKDMKEPGPDGSPIGCEVCHSTRTGKTSLASTIPKTSYPLVGAHRQRHALIATSLPTWKPSSSKRTSPRRQRSARVATRMFTAKQFEKDGVTSCVDCHNTAKWKPSLFDHDKSTNFRYKACIRTCLAPDATRTTATSRARTFSQACDVQPCTSSALRERSCPRSRGCPCGIRRKARSDAAL